MLRAVCEGLHWLGAGADGAESGHGVRASKDRKREHGQQVRVIEYTLNGSDPSTPEHYRLLTNVLDHVRAPADELAVLYPERWESWGGAKASSMSSKPTCAPTARCCAAKPPRLSGKSSGA